MRGGLGPKPREIKVRAGTTIMAEGEAAEEIMLLLDGVVQVEAAGAELAELGPGSVFGERAALEQGRRTATVRALTDCRLVSYPAADLPVKDLRELATGHHREDEGREDERPGPRPGTRTPDRSEQ
ncbi:MAG: cyclic nucleotide-binding domain-containing protein [Actinobacteria bacterium]|nr:cyclic nucleotide-binding domain-containing protein [Actinomycetota bacterium]